MLRYVFLGYIILYAIIAVGLFSLHALIVPSEEKENDRPWETPLDISLSVLGLAGMLLLYLQFEPNWLKIVWIPVSVLLLLGQVWLNLRDRLGWVRSAKADRNATRAADLTTLVFLTPSLALNLVYAFRRSI
ncbi:MAG TPA: hypothetical protein VN673_10590 [Clostridia bacterium]|nr:hypothetical protein [Clostridia bacterium]